MCYTDKVQTSFYVSGFIYNLKTNQILLIQSAQENKISPLWSALGGDSIKGEEAEVAFQRIIYKLLNIDLKLKNIHPIYDYFHQTKNKVNFVFYAKVRSSRIFNNFQRDDVSWFTFSEIVKLPLATQMKHDIVVGERVINARKRDTEAKKLFNSLAS